MLGRAVKVFGLRLGGGSDIILPIFYFFATKTD